MNAIFEKFKKKMPYYEKKFQNLFDTFTGKFGTEGESKESRGKDFSNNYELYIYAFFLGLYSNSKIPISGSKTRFKFEIGEWGKKNENIRIAIKRNSFTELQEYIFMALVAKSDVDFIELDKGNLNIDEAVRQLINTMEEYANAGLQIIAEHYEEEKHKFSDPSYFLNLIKKAKS